MGARAGGIVDESPRAWVAPGDGAARATDSNRAAVVHVDLDGAWGDIPGVWRVDLTAWGPRVRYFARRGVMAAFWEQARGAVGDAALILYGSGDFHHLTALWLRRLTRPTVVVCFDNHPDWDRRPPRWACGAWVNRALELPAVRHVAVWGCGNFELDRRHRMTGNRQAVRDGRLGLFAWAERYPRAAPGVFEAVTRDTWRERFEAFARWAGRLPADVYVTVDLDCLCAAAAATNWEAGLFTPDDVAWAVGRLAAHAPVVGGDVCGAYSRPVFSGTVRRLAAWWDHPRTGAVTAAEAAERNTAALAPIRAALTAAVAAGRDGPRLSTSEGA